MRRRVIVLGAVAALLAAVATQLSWGGAKDAVEGKVAGINDATYRVDAIFDSAKGLLPGQLVKIAGARAGIIERVALTPQYRARIEMRVDRRFASFRADARCAIKEEGLIGERFVQCDPGRDQAPLAARDGRPTVPVAQTALPVGLIDLFGIVNAPARARLGIVISTLGLGVAGRGADVNALLRRANPALTSTRRVLRIVGDQRRELQAAIGATDRVLATLARREVRVEDFIDQAARVTRRTAGRSSQLALSIERLPGLLARARPALERLHALAKAGTPVLDDLRASAPQLQRLLVRAKPFAAAATPVLGDLRAALPGTRASVRATTPLVRQLRTFADSALPTGRGLGQLVDDLARRGFVENLLRTVYRLSATYGRFDSISHLIPILLLINPSGNCLLYASTPNPNCDARYHPVGAQLGRRTPKAQRSGASRPSGKPQPAAPTTTSEPPVRLPLPKVRNPLPEIGETVTKTVDRLLDFLLG